MATIDNFSCSISEAEESLRLCDSRTRLPTLLNFAYNILDDAWLTLLGQAWEICDNISCYLDELLDTPLGHYPKGPIREMMSDEEMEQFNRLPDEVIIYRGCYVHNKWGLSWTTSREIASKFPFLSRYRANGQPLLVKAKVQKANILALKLGRDESEIIAYRPKHISTSHIRLAAGV